MADAPRKSEDPARVRKYARIYSVITSYRHSGTYFKKTVKELASDISRGVGKRCGGSARCAPGAPHSAFANSATSATNASRISSNTVTFGAWLTSSRCARPPSPAM